MNMNARAFCSGISFASNEVESHFLISDINANDSIVRGRSCVIIGKMRRRKTAIFFLILGISLSVLAVALNVGWILLNLREVALLVFGVIFFALIITGLILNTIFLVREIRRNEQHDAFLNSVTHELKTPIASIRLYLDTLRQRDVDPETRAEFYEKMGADSDRLLRTIEQVLEASRTRDKDRLIDPTRFNINEVVAASVANAEQRHAKTVAAIKFSPSDQPAMIDGDLGEIASVFDNLIENAIKYSGPEPRISVKVRPRRGGGVQVFVRDNGAGIAAGDLKRIFNRFFRAGQPGTERVRGTGLGLFIVRSILDKHRGKIEATSRGLGKGSTFIVTLPDRLRK